jgi:broad specificity phosphatase PhoE
MKNKKNFCTIYIVRHGQTEWNEKKITQGQSESSISSIGIGQAEKVAEKLRSIHASVIYSSDMSMAFRTAEILRLDRKIPIRASRLLRGRSYGIFEGKSIDVYKKTLKSKLEERENLPEVDYSSFKLAPSIETDKELVTRFINKLKKIASANLNKSVLIVTHGGCIKNFLIEIGGVERKFLFDGSFEHGGHMKLFSNGKVFYIKEIDGLKSKQN